ncbi:maleylpyruvate isomerase N-terminal domain-containing protein [Saccharothrix isguenensis]
MAQSTAAASRITPGKWQAARTAVREAGERFADLVLSVPDPSVLATEDWSVAVTAAHVTGIAWNNTAMVAETEQELPIPGVTPHVATTTVDNIHTGLNPGQLRSFTERDPVRLVERLRASIDGMLDATADTDPRRTVGWLGGSQVPVAGVFAHMVNELLVHGRDVARAVKVPWPVADEQAALFFELFLVEIIRHGYGCLLDDDRPVRPGRIAVEFRSDHTTPVVLVLNEGVVTVEEPDGDSDVRLRFRPAGLNLALFHRMTYARAALTGAVVVRGRRPWLLPAFLRKVRLP